MRTTRGVTFEEAADVRAMVEDIISTLELEYIDVSQIICIRSKGRKTRAKALIHGLPRIWQKALNSRPLYIIEVVSEKFDVLDREEKLAVIIHELHHIPSSFSGSLRKHTDDFYRRAELLFRRYIARTNRGEKGDRSVGKSPT